MTWGYTPSGAFPGGHRFESCPRFITTALEADFIAFKGPDQGLKPKTANHYRSILRRVFNWADQERGIRLPNGLNPAAKVRPYKEQAPQIRYLTLPQIEEQIKALRFKPQMQTMVAVLIYAGLRREELLWLTLDDVSLTHRQRGNGLIRIQSKTIDGQSWQPKTAVNRSVPISRALREGNKEAGLQWSCLDYRHTFGSQLAQRGVSLYKISSLMGNSPEICRRHYASLVPEAMHGEIDFGTLSHPQTQGFAG